MGCRLITGLLAVLSATMMCGCRSPQDPSDAVRHASYIHCRSLFTGNNEAAKRQTYIVFSGGPQFRATMDRQTGTVNWFAGKKGFSTGLAIGFEADGYLVTVAHALNTNIFVIGWFDGKMDMKPARVVFKGNSNTHADLALIKTEGNLDTCCILGEGPRSGDQVFAIVCYRNSNNTDWDIDFAGGKVLGIAPDPLRGSLRSIRTDVPLARGDSGGPLLSISGQLIGVNRRIGFTLRKHWSDSFYPDKEFIQRLVKEDRSSRAPNPASAVDGGLPVQSNSRRLCPAANDSHR